MSRRKVEIDVDTLMTLILGAYDAASTLEAQLADAPRLASPRRKTIDDEVKTRVDQLIAASQAVDRLLTDAERTDFHSRHALSDAWPSGMDGGA